MSFQAEQAGSEGEWEPTMRLRIVIPAKPDKALPPWKLQQLWRKPKIDYAGRVTGYDYEWRDIPTEVIE